MKKEFTLDEIIVLRGCYSEEQVKLLCKDRIYTITELLNLDISIKDKQWFLYNSCDLTLKEKFSLSYLLGKAISPVYTKKYPSDNRINACWKAIEDFNNNLISKEELIKYRDSAYDAATAAAYIVNEAYSAAAYIVNEAYSAAAYAAIAANATYSAADYAANTTNAAYSAANAANVAYSAVYIAAYITNNYYTTLLKDIMIDFCNSI